MLDAHAGKPQEEQFLNRQLIPQVGKSHHDAVRFPVHDFLQVGESAKPGDPGQRTGAFGIVVEEANDLEAESCPLTEPVGDLAENRRRADEENAFGSDSSKQRSGIEQPPGGDHQQHEQTAENHGVARHDPAADAVTHEGLGQKGDSDRETDLLNDFNFRMNMEVFVKIVQVKPEHDGGGDERQAEKAVVVK